MKAKMLEFDLTTKCLSIKGLTLDKLLAEVAKGEPVFLKRGRSVRFVIMPADDGDQEAYALRSNPEFLAYLDAAREHAKKGPWTPLADVYDELGIPRRPKASQATEKGKGGFVGGEISHRDYGSCPL